MSLFDTAFSTGDVAPYWFVKLFKIIGFALHMIPMGMLLVGIPVALLLWLFGSVNVRRLAQRIFRQIPIFVALAINFGVAPLLFVQLAYSKLFYTSEILLAGQWLALIVFILAAYVASYFCALRAKQERKWRVAFWGFASSGCFLLVGFFFAEFWTLFERPYEWENLLGSILSFSFLGNTLSLGGNGAVSGLGVYWNNPTQDPTVLLRLAAIIGLSFYTVAFWIVFDSHVLYRGKRTLTDDEQMRLLEAEEVEQTKEKGKEARRKRALKPIQENSEKYPGVVTTVACALLLVGALITIPSLVGYLMKRLTIGNSEAISSVLWNVLVWGTFVSLGLPFIFVILSKLKVIGGKTFAFGFTFCELLLVGFFATLRQTIQNVQLSPYCDPNDFCGSSDIQWSPVLVFLGVLLAVAIWIGIILRMTSHAGMIAKAPAEKKSKKSKKEKKADSKPADGTVAESAKSDVRSSMTRVVASSKKTSITPLNGKNKLK